MMDYKKPVICELVLCAINAKRVIRHDHRKKIAKEMVAAGLIERVSGTLIITYKMTDKAKEIVKSLDDSHIGGFFPHKADIEQAKANLLADET